MIRRSDYCMPFETGRTARAKVCYERGPMVRRRAGARWRAPLVEREQTPTTDRDEIRSAHRARRGRRASRCRPQKLSRLHPLLLTLISVVEQKNLCDKRLKRHPVRAGSDRRRLRPGYSVPREASAPSRRHLLGCRLVCQALQAVFVKEPGLQSRNS